LIVSPAWLTLDASIWWLSQAAVNERVLKRNTKEEIQGFIKRLLTDGSVLCTDGNLSYKGLDEDLNILHKRLVASDNQRVEDGIYHIQTLNNYIMNWRKLAH